MSKYKVGDMFYFKREDSNKEAFSIIKEVRNFTYITLDLKYDGIYYTKYMINNGWNIGIVDKHSTKITNNLIKILYGTETKCRPKDSK